MTGHECLDCGHHWTDDKPVERSWTNLPNEFWTARPELAQIRQAAHSRLVSADAVLVATLARIIMLTPPNITIPAIVGSQVSLNLFTAIIDQSGGGKSAATSVARELLPHDRKDIADPILPSSGEGLIEAYMGMVDVDGDDGKKRKERRQVKTAGLAWVDEGQGLLAQGERSGSTIMETIRSAWMGGDLGQHNAAEDRRRWLKSHRYRLCMIVGFQLAYAASLIADGEGGTPQRFTFASARDPHIDAGAEWPGTLDWQEPPTMPGTADLKFADILATDIRQRRLQRSTGELEVDPLDTHADLRKMKLAAALAILDRRQNITECDWHLAEMIDRTSCAVRTLAIEHDRVSKARNERAYAERRAEQEAVIEDSALTRALEQGARAIGRKVARADDLPVPKRDLMAAPAGRLRKLVEVDDMIALALDRGWIEPDGDGWTAGDSRPV